MQLMTCLPRNPFTCSYGWAFKGGTTGWSVCTIPHAGSWHCISATAAPNAGGNAEPERWEWRLEGMRGNLAQVNQTSEKHWKWSGRGKTPPGSIFLKSLCSTGAGGHHGASVGLWEDHSLVEPGASKDLGLFGFVVFFFCKKETSVLSTAAGLTVISLMNVAQGMFQVEGEMWDFLCV